MGVAKVDINVMNFSAKKKKDRKLDCQKRKHKSQYNSTISLNNSKNNKDIYLFIKHVCDGGDKSTFEKCLPKSSPCVIGNSELFSLTLILTVSPEMCFTEAMKFLAFKPQYLVIWAQAFVHKKFIIPR